MGIKGCLPKDGWLGLIFALSYERGGGSGLFSKGCLTSHAAAAALPFCYSPWPVSLATSWCAAQRPQPS